MEVDPISDAPVPNTLEQLDTEQRLLKAREPLFDPTMVVGRTPSLPQPDWKDVSEPQPDWKDTPDPEIERQRISEGFTSGLLTADEAQKAFREAGLTPDSEIEDIWETIPFPADQAEKDKAASEAGERPATRAEIEEMFAKRGEMDALFGLSAANLAEYIEKRSKSGDANPPTIQSLMLARRDQWDDETKAKATEVWKILNERGAQPGGFGFGKLIPGAKDFLAGLGAWTSKAIQGQDAWALGLLNAVTPGPETPEVRQKRLEAQQVAAEAVSGMTAGGEHLVKIPGVIGENLFGKPAKDWTPAESAERFAHSLTEQINTENTLAGERGLITQSPEVKAEMEEAGLGVRAEESAKVMAGNPVDFWAFGKGLGVIAPIFRIPKIAFRAATMAGRGAQTEAAIVASLPQSLQGAMVGAFEREAAKRTVVGEISKAAGEGIGTAARGIDAKLAAAGKLIPSAQTVVGKSIQGAGAVVDWLGKWSEKVTPIAVPIAGAVSGAAAGAALPGLGQVVAALSAAGGTRVLGAARPVMATLRAIRKQAQNLEYSGKSIAAQTAEEIAEAPIKGAASAAVVGAAKSVGPAVAASVHGAVLDIGLFALTAATPQDQNVLQLGTILGIANSLRGAAINAAGEVKHGGRDWGHDTPLPTSGTFPVWEKMHSDAYNGAAPGVRRRVNSIRQLLKDIDADTDSFMADPTHVEHRQVGTIKIGDTTHVKWKKVNTDVESTLVSLGMPKAQAELYASQSGFFDASFDVPGQPGKTKRVFVVVDSGTAPHEAKHAFQNVNGEAANLALDKIVQDNFTPEVWDYLGRDYTEQLLGRRLGQKESWQDIVLDASGEGNAAANLKLKLHGIEALQEKLGRPATKAEVDALAAVSLTEGELVPVTAEAQGGWRNVLTPAERKQAADKYIAREISADTFAVVFKHLGPALAAKGGLINTFARIVAATVEALGGDLLRGRTTELGVPLKQPIVEAVTAQVRGRLAEVAGRKSPSKPVVVAVPKGMSSAAPPGTPEQEAEKAKAVVESAPDEKTGPDVLKPDGTLDIESQTAREVLGATAEAMALRGSMMVDYRSAPGTPAGVIEVMLDRRGRRGQVEEGRGMSAEDKILWEKLFTPIKVAVTQAGEYQVQGLAQRVLGRNANEAAKFLAEVNRTELSPFEINIANKTFTEAGWRNLFDKITIYNGNQAVGLTGRGTPLDIGRAREFGFYEPAGNRQKVGDLTDAEMNFINYLFGYPLPGAGKSVLARGGKAQYAEQLISQATEPGRAQPLVVPRTFESAEARKLGFAGEQLLEVNPLRAQIEQAARDAGREPPSPIEVWQNLNLRDIVRVQHTPELPSLAGNEVTKRAGLSPKPREERGPVRFSPMPANEMAIRSAAIRDENGRIFEGAFHSAIQEIVEFAGSKGPLTDGFVTNRKAPDGQSEFLDRDEAFARAEQIGQLPKGQLEMPGGGLETMRFEEVRKFSPSKDRKEIELIGPDGKKYRAMFDGYMDMSLIGLGQVPQITPLVDLPGSKVKGSTTYGPSLEKAGYKLPADLPPPEAIESGEAKFSPPKRKPNAAEEDVFDLVHYSSTPGLKTVDPKHFGKGKATPTDLRGGPKSYFFVKDSNFGQDAAIFENTGLHPHAATVKGTDLYDLRAGKPDDLGWRKTVNREEADDIVKDAGYKGIILDTADGRQVVSMFKSVKVIDERTSFSPPKREDKGYAAGEYWLGKTGLNYAPEGHLAWSDNNIGNIPAGKGSSISRTMLETERQGFLRTIVTGEGIEIDASAKYPAWKDVPRSYKEAIEDLQFSRELPVFFDGKLISERPGAKFSPKREQFEDAETIREALSSPGWAIITGTQEKIAGKAASWDDPRNIAANARLRAELKARGYEVLPVEGKYKGESQGESFAVMGITPADAQALGKKYGQESILTNKGLVYGDGSTTPAVPEKTMIGPEAEAQDFYSITPDGTAFSIGLDFDKPYKPVGEQQQLFGKTESEAQDFSRRMRARIADKKERFPESAPLGYEKNADGSFRINAKTGKPVAEKQDHEFLNSGLAKEVGKGLRGEAREAAYVKAAGDDMAAEYQKAVKDPEVAAGAKWYSTLRTRLRKLFGDQSQLVCEVLAALSSRTPVGTNYKFGIDAINKFNAGDYDAQLAKYQEGLDRWDAGNISDYVQATGLTNPERRTFVSWWIDTHDLKPRQSNGKLFAANSKALLRALHGSWTGGKKTRQFSQNMSGADFGSTIDVWAARTLHRISNENRVARWRILAEHENAVQDADFDVAQKVFKYAADKVGIKPDALQGVLWFREKDLWEKRGWTRGAGAEKSDISSLIAETEKLPTGQYKMKSPQGELKFSPKGEWSEGRDAREGDDGLFYEFIMPGDTLPVGSIQEDVSGTWTALFKAGRKPESQTFAVEQEARDWIESQTKSPRGEFQPKGERGILRPGVYSVMTSYGTRKDIEFAGGTTRQLYRAYAGKVDEFGFKRMTFTGPRNTGDDEMVQPRPTKR